MMRSHFMRSLSALIVALPATAMSAGTSYADWAVAFGQTGERAWAFGTGIKAQDKAAARKVALSHCRDKGSNCKIILVGDGGCVALAVGLTDNAWAVEQRDTRLEAGTVALKECVSESNGDCEIKKTFCED